ncbi:hypothetical protein FA13DRAFT_1785322 [Coprinellus micaceus]|uniref:Uncharacterized protein n=1 Tax=Coprinellus micaceus TaxID=71717 RepID=A0A4Y7TYH2_COPMI|nr:hypothetical protein FA13DRAFT_1785322 [Coprinellus micaceus]
MAPIKTNQKSRALPFLFLPPHLSLLPPRQMKFNYLLVNGSADGDGLTTVSRLFGNEKLVPCADDPLPFFLEYSEGVDALEALKPYLKILIALSAQRGVMGYKAFAQALALAMAPAVTEVWPHRTQLFGIMNSRRNARKIITHNQEAWVTSPLLPSDYEGGTPANATVLPPK